MLRDEDITETLDLCGEKCPDTFVYTKIKLEELAHSGGGILKVVVDYPPAVENIPRSLKEEQIPYKLLEIRNAGGRIYEIFIRVPKVE